MKFNAKKLIGALSIIATLGFLTSCNSFCNIQDQAAYRYGYDPVNTAFFDTRDDALAYVNAVIPEGYEKVGFDYMVKDEAGNLVSFISEDTFKDTKLYYILPGSIKTLSLEPNKDGIKEEYELVLSKNYYVASIESTAKTNNIFRPYNNFYCDLDYYTINNMLDAAKKAEDKNYKDVNLSDLTFESLYGYTFNDYLNYCKNTKDSELVNKILNGYDNHIGKKNSLLMKYGYTKFEADENGNYFANIEKWNSEIANEKGPNYAMNSDFLNTYKNTLNNQLQNLKTCISITDDELFGHVSNDPINEKVLITNKAVGGFWKGWGNAFSEHGFLEGLLVYPISYGVEALSHHLGMNGWGQIFAVLIVTIVIRAFFMLISLPSTISQQKMTFIQPEVAKLQQKYPNANTNQYEKQMLAQAQMALYKKHNVHPFGSLLILVVQFPLFICVWNAMTGSASLASGSVLGLYLSDTIWSVLKDFSNWPHNGWWTALVLILLMSGAQIVSMLLPNWINKAREKKEVRKTVVSKSQQDSQKQTKILSYVMTGMIIIMGFTLPSAMGVYWFAGALFSIAQTFISQAIIHKKAKGGKK